MSSTKTTNRDEFQLQTITKKLVELLVRTSLSQVPYVKPTFQNLFNNTRCLFEETNDTESSTFSGFPIVQHFIFLKVSPLNIFTLTWKFWKSFNHLSNAVLFNFSNPQIGFSGSTGTKFAPTLPSCKVYPKPYRLCLSDVIVPWCGALDTLSSFVRPSVHPSISPSVRLPIHPSV